MRCSLLRYDLVKRDYCMRDGHQVKPYFRACEHFNEILGRFGGWTAPVKEEPKQLTPNMESKMEIESDKIYNMDCLEGMRRIPTASIDAIK